MNKIKSDMATRVYPFIYSFTDDVNSSFIQNQKVLQFRYDFSFSVCVRVCDTHSVCPVHIPHFVYMNVSSSIFHVDNFIGIYLECIFAMTTIRLTYGVIIIAIHDAIAYQHQY